jgi:SAM-dependent methyltransferase
MHAALADRAICLHLDGRTAWSGSSAGFPPTPTRTRYSTFLAAALTGAKSRRTGSDRRAAADGTCPQVILPRVIELRHTARAFATRHQLSWRYQYGRLALADGRDFVLRRQDAGIPPKRLRQFVGDGDFRAIGEEFLGLARELGGLRPDDRVLDVGSGLGRMAVPLTRYLSDRGSYDGLEIMPRTVRWCQRHITPSHSTFRFHHADVYNRLYNPKGRLPEETFVFPFDSGVFGFALLTSVFTHMLPSTVRQYLAEIARVLKPGGTVLATAFLLDPVSRAAVEAGTSTFGFTHQIADHGVMTSNLAIPEAAIAYPSEYFEQLAESSGLTLSRPVHFGTWSGRADGRSTQDIIILKAPRG